MGGYASWFEASSEADQGFPRRRAPTLKRKHQPIILPIFFKNYVKLKILDGGARP